MIHTKGNPAFRPGKPIAQHPLFGAARRPVLLAITLAAASVPVGLNWSWFVNVGLAPILIGFLPCAAMCGLGLCMRGDSGASCSGRRAVGDSSPPSRSSET